MPPIAFEAMPVMTHDSRILWLIRGPFVNNLGPQMSLSNDLLFLRVSCNIDLLQAMRRCCV